MCVCLCCSDQLTPTPQTFLPSERPCVCVCVPGMGVMKKQCVNASEPTEIVQRRRPKRKETQSERGQGREIRDPRHMAANDTSQSGVQLRSVRERRVRVHETRFRHTTLCEQISVGGTSVCSFGIDLPCGCTKKPSEGNKDSRTPITY